MDLLDVLQHYWFIIIFVGGIIAQWVRNESKVNEIKTKMGEMEKTFNDKIKEMEDDEGKTLKDFRDRIRQAELKYSAIETVSGDIKGINAKLDIILKKIQL